MMRSLWTAGSGMLAQQVNIDNIANNLANVNTTGYKKSRVDFQDLLYQTVRSAGTPIIQGTQVPTGIQIGRGVGPVSSQRKLTQGEARPSGGPLDVNIEGDGFFQVLMPDGSVAYTRDGAFKRDGEGRVVTSDGFPISPEVIIPEDATDISISTDGNISVKIKGQDTPQSIGQIELVRFINSAGLKSIGRNLYKITAASGEPIIGTPGLDGFGTLAHGYLEMSNVQVVEEMVSMIVAQRAYEVNSKAIQAADEMLQTANNLRR